MTGKKGRKRKPTVLSLIDGNPGKRPLPENEIVPAPVYNPDAPADFDETMRAKWSDLCGKLARVRLLTELDLDAVEMYVREWVNYHEAIADLAARGKLLRTPSGGTLWNPSWSQLRHSQKVLRSIMAEFGMTPSTRSGLTADGDGKGGSTWDGF